SLFSSAPLSTPSTLFPYTTLFRSPVVLGQAVPGARARRPRARAPLRLLYAAARQPRGTAADLGDALPLAAARRLAGGAAHARYPGRARAHDRRVPPPSADAASRAGARVRSSGGWPPDAAGIAAALLADADARRGPLADARPAHRRGARRRRLRRRRAGRAPRPQDHPMNAPSRRSL